MSRSNEWSLLLPKSVRSVPADLAAVLGVTLLTVAVVFLPTVRETPIRIVVGLGFVLFVPGYAFVAALFPERGPELHSDDEGTDAEGIDVLERVALSFGTSIAIAPLVGLALNFTLLGLRLTPIVATLSAFIAVMVFVAVQRRSELSPEDRFYVPYRRWVASARDGLVRPDTRTDMGLNVLLAVSVLLAAGSVGYSVATTPDGSTFSELYLLTEDESGELVADDYPTEFTRGESKPLVVGVENHERTTQSYTVVSVLQRVSVENNTTTVLEQQRLQEFQPTLEHNETWRQRHSVEPTMSGDRLRLVYLVYRGDAPADPTVENAYRETHLWINVSEP
ncbi:DUF1616 domain-containing protein [Halopelagius longus]|uniref:DUF1616 domain-containing protein n=1 Tax=Halopelagius longus TaxID=1236180 RepID=A0A1H1GK89_9EURY|nr:DUF1616 domain-containing protein [Halopelagius longus]RDI69691.1 DUF1616 domain-containing protein [Halopelagius longus]SDR13581.1 Uncharacterized membrane protein [Halopelagius longus]